LIGADSWARRFASPPGTVTPSGITLDATGHFGHELLVTMLTQPRGDHCDLVAPGETGGPVFVRGPDGSVVTLVVSGLPHGGDIGVESAGFMPPRLSAGDAAYLADRSPTPAVSPRRPVAAGAGAGGRLTDVLPEVATCFHRPAGTPRPKLMTEAD
jgi:hypothetical protein